MSHQTERCLLLGPIGVGKSSVSQRLCEDTFNLDSEQNGSSVGQSSGTATVMVSKRRCDIIISDFEDSLSMDELLQKVNETDVFDIYCLVFSAIHDESYDDLIDHMADITQKMRQRADFAQTTVALVLANKMDLMTYETGREQVGSKGDVLCAYIDKETGVRSAYFGVSAKQSREGIFEAFVFAVRTLRDLCKNQRSGGTGSSSSSSSSSASQCCQIL